MAFLTSPVTVAVPATSANLGPGFDSLGVALALHDEVTATVTGDQVRVGVSGQGAGELPGDERHLVAATMLATFGRLGARPPGFELACVNRIPQARGLGSSSAAIVAGILLARSLVPGGADRLGQAGVIRLAAEIEGHPDNVAPCVLGGFSIAWTAAAGQAGDGAHAVALDSAAGVMPVVFVPAQRGYTAHRNCCWPPPRTAFTRTTGRRPCRTPPGWWPACARPASRRSSADPGPACSPWCRTASPW